MSEHDGPSDDQDEQPRPIKVTDKRRINLDDQPGSQRADPPPGVAGSGAGGGSSAGEASGRSEAPPAGPELGDAAAAAREQAAEYLEHLQRLQAEFDNYRKRVLKEQTRAVEMASEPVMRRLLEVLDEFDLALMAADRKPEFEQFLRGVELVYAKLADILRAEGLERIEAEGKPFDPSLHEALMQTGHGDGEPVVTEVLRPGYTLRGRVLRPAGVKVARK